MTIRDTCLSIDLDYFCQENIQKQFNNFCKKIFQFSKKHSIDVKYVHKHHQILTYFNDKSFINKFNPNILINIDYHSDIGNALFENGEYKGTTNILSEGNWVQKVNWNNNLEYKWYYPSYDAGDLKGLCHGDNEPDPFNTDNPNYYNWCSIKKEHLSINDINNIDLDRINFICFCISIDYWNSNNNFNKNSQWYDKFVDTYKIYLSKIMGSKCYLDALNLAIRNSDYYYNTRLQAKNLNYQWNDKRDIPTMIKEMKRDNVY